VENLAAGLPVSQEGLGGINRVIKGVLLREKEVKDVRVMDWGIYGESRTKTYEIKWKKGDCHPADIQNSSSGRTY